MAGGANLRPFLATLDHFSFRLDISTDEVCHVEAQISQCLYVW